MQLLCRADISDFDTWKEAFDSDAESRRSAGLTLLQLWRDADAPTRVFQLYEVNDTDKARAFLGGAQARLNAGHAGVTGQDCHFLETL